MTVVRLDDGSPLPDHRGELARSFTAAAIRSPDPVGLVGGDPARARIVTGMPDDDEPAAPIPPWRPWRLRQSSSEADYEVLHEGVPPWLQLSIGTWLANRLQDSVQNAGYIGTYRDWSHDVLARVERELRHPLDWSAGPESAGRKLLNDARADADLALELLDYFLRDMIPWRNEDALNALFDHLAQAGSAWQIRARDPDDMEQGFSLERRVDVTTSAAADEAFGAGRAGRHLRAAWAHVYGRSPDPSRAYAESVKAVEAAGIATVIPKDKVPTLGKMITALRDAPHKWLVTVGGMAPDDQVLTVASMCELLWRGQTDRHGIDGPASPVDIEQSHAETGVQLAVTLVQWFATGKIAPVVT